MSQSHHTPDSGGNPESWISPQECSQMLMHAPVGVLKSTPEGKLLFANPALARMFGYSSETEMLEAVSDIARELYADPEDRQELLRLLQEQGQVVNYECPMLRKDGSRFWVSRNMQAVRDREGMVLHFFGFVSEITGRKRAEEALLQKSRELEERVKELDCLYGLSRLMDQTAVSSQELMQSVVELIPSGLHYPDIAYARLLLEDVTFKSPGFQETAWKHAADIVISGNKAGRIEVFYLQKVSGAEGSPFLREERQLIESVAERLGKTLEHIQNKEALQRNEEKFRSLVENADAIIYSQTPDGYLTYLSPRFTELLGYEVQDYIGRHVSDLLHPEDYPLAQRHLRDLFKTEQRQSKIEIRLLQKDGRWRWFTVNTSPQSYAHAKIESIMGVAHDITERKQAEEQLRESEERFRAIVEGAPDAMFVQTEQKFAYLNPQALELFGARQESELLGQPKMDRVHPDFKKLVVERMRRLDEQRQPVLERFELKFLRLDGQEVWVEITGQPIIYQGKEGGLVFARDITERKELEKLKEDVERITRHDLKTPLNGILGIPQILLEDDNLRQEQRELLEHIQMSGHRMLDMINMSLSLYQIERGEYQFQPQPIDLLAVLQDLQKDLEPLLRAHKISLSWSLPGRAEEENFLVYAEKLLCYTMLSNLIKNAVEATPPGEKVLICLEEADKDLARISIHNPEVIPEEVQNRFGQKYVTTGKRQGTGLGVYSARLIADIMQGSFSWHSSEQEGTWVKVTMPRPPDWMSRWAG